MPLTRDQDIALLRRSVEIAEAAKAAGNHPFGCLLADEHGNILMEQGNDFTRLKGPGHAESILAREAALKFDADTLLKATLVTNFEPCAMCAGTTYWAGIGALVYGMTEKRLAQLTGANEENLTMDLPCHVVFDAGQRRTNVRGPYPELETEIARAHIGFW